MCRNAASGTVRSKGFNPKEYVENLDQRVANNALQALWKLR